MFRTSIALTVILFLAARASGQAPSASIAAEADAIAYGLSGFSGIISVTLPGKLQFAIGAGRYEVPRLLLKADEHDDVAGWKATATSIQVARITYRFNGAMRNGPAVGAIVLNQRWKLRSAALGGETRFRPLSVGATAGYYVHVGKHFYVYPTAALTYNRVISGSTSVQETNYHVDRLAPNGSVHVGWEWSR